MTAADVAADGRAPRARRALTTAYWAPGDHPRDRTEGMRVVSDEEKAELARQLHAFKAKERGALPPSFDAIREARIAWPRWCSSVALLADQSRKYRPGWLADDSTWREYLDAMPYEDRRFLTESWELAGGHSPTLDTSWITMEDAGSPHSAWPVVLVAAVFAVAVVVLPILTLTGVRR